MVSIEAGDFDSSISDHHEGLVCTAGISVCYQQKVSDEVSLELCLLSALWFYGPVIMKLEVQLSI